MSWKNKFEKALKLYFVLVTFITVLLMILGLAFDSNRMFGYSVFASPLVYAAIGVLPVFLPEPKREISMKGLILRRIFELGIIEMFIFFLVFSSDNIPTEKKSVVIGIALGIIIIYVLTNVLEYLYEKRESEELNKFLADYLEAAENDKSRL